MTENGRTDRKAGVRAVASWCGALMSLALIGGLVYWGYQLVHRDLAGIPVIKAAGGAMRVAPKEPGGDRAEHQGLSVSRIAAGADPAPPVPLVRLAPQSTRLTEEDMPPQAEADAKPVPAIAATDLAVAEALGLDPAQIFAASLQVDEPLRPLPRPASRRAASVLSSSDAPGELVQLGAFDTAEEADGAWRGLVERFPDLLDSHSRRVERVDRAGRTFWRLRASGFEDLADARRVCAALTAGRAECIPVVLNR